MHAHFCSSVVSVCSFLASLDIFLFSGGGGGACLSHYLKCQKETGKANMCVCVLRFESKLAQQLVRPTRHVSSFTQ